MLKRKYEEIKADLLEKGFEEKPFTGSFVHGFYFEREVQKKNSHEFQIFPFFGDEYLGIRLDWEINTDGLHDHPEGFDLDAHLIKLFEGALISNVLDIAGNVSKKMTNNDLFAPIIPKEAYDE